MQAIIENLLREHGGKLTGQLETKGFSPSEAQSFLPPALEQITSVMGAGSFDLKSLMGGGGLNIGVLMSRIDLGGVANEAGVDAAKAQTGLTALIPQVLDLLKGQAGGLEGLGSLLGGKSGGAAGMLSGLAGRFFKR